MTKNTKVNKEENVSEKEIWKKQKNAQGVQILR